MTTTHGSFTNQQPAVSYRAGTTNDGPSTFTNVQFEQTLINFTDPGGYFN